jgi:hypothetical protein
MNRQTFITSSSLALLILSSSASVVSGQDKPSSPRMLDELDFHTPYSAHNDDVTHATQHGLDARVLRALDHPETPNAERVALITGAVSVDGAEKARGKYLRFLLERNRHHDNVGLDHLEAHELMCAGLLGASAGSARMVIMARTARTNVTARTARSATTGSKAMARALALTGSTARTAPNNAAA